MNNKNSFLRHIPNVITSLNLLSGCVAIHAALNKDFRLALWFVLMAAFFDLADGMAARKLNAYSAFGKIYDSFADLISFGMVPAVMMYQLLGEAVKVQEIDFSEYTIVVIQLVSFLIVVFSALRLAKFHLDGRQKDTFIGLPTPANALLLVSFVDVISRFVYPYLSDLFLNIYLLMPVVLISCFLLVSELPMFSFKKMNFRFQDNKIQYIFIIGAIILILLLRMNALPLIVGFYIILSSISAMWKKGYYSTD